MWLRVARRRATGPGWDEFRKLEADCFEAASAAKKSKVVACGGGIIETTRGMELMRSHSPAARFSCVVKAERVLSG